MQLARGVRQGTLEERFGNVWGTARLDDEGVRGDVPGGRLRIVGTELLGDPCDWAAVNPCRRTFVLDTTSVGMRVGGSWPAGLLPSHEARRSLRRSSPVALDRDDGPTMASIGRWNAYSTPLGRVGNAFGTPRLDSGGVELLLTDVGIPWRLAHEVQRFDLERLGEPPDDVQTERLIVLASLNARLVDAGSIRQLLLEQSAGGAPVVERRRSRRRRASGHRSAGHRTCWDHALAGRWVDSGHSTTLA